MPSPQRWHGEPSPSQRRRLADSITSLRQLVESKGTLQSIQTCASDNPLKQFSKSIKGPQTLPLSVASKANPRWNSNEVLLLHEKSNEVPKGTSLSLFWKYRDEMPRRAALQQRRQTYGCFSKHKQWVAGINKRTLYICLLNTQNFFILL